MYTFFMHDKDNCIPFYYFFSFMGLFNYFFDLSWSWVLLFYIVAE